MQSTDIAVTIDSIRNAANRIRSVAHRTPILTSQSINRMADGEVFFKCENFQRVGAFKFRGAYNAVLSLTDDEARRGVATHSSGNHAQAVALAASLREIPAYIVMPQSASEVKIGAVREYGGLITLCQPTLKDREETLEDVVLHTGAMFIHPYNDDRVISGQGTAALELLEDVESLDYLLTPIGGGGLTAGSLIAAHSISPSTLVIAGEPHGADDAFQSFKAGKIIPQTEPNTIADGLHTSVGERPFAIIQKHLEDVITVTDVEIIHAMRTLWERMKIVIEPSAAVPVAVLLSGKLLLKGKRAGVIISGGNVDLNSLPWFPKGS